MDVLKEASQLGVNLYEEHQRFVQSFHPKWRADENVMLLLSAIALFTPERSNVLHKDVVKLEQVLPDLRDSISPTFYDEICAQMLVIQNVTFFQWAKCWAFVICTILLVKLTKQIQQKQGF